MRAYWSGGGGGGAGAVGTNAGSTAGNGGAGLSSSITGAAVYYAGGGAGRSVGGTMGRQALVVVVLPTQTELQTLAAGLAVAVLRLVVLAL